MSRYGPRQEGHGPPRRPDDYGPPSDPWSHPGHPGGAPAGHAYPPPTYQSRGHPYSEYPPQPPPAAPPPPPPRRRPAGLYVVLALLALLAAGGMGYGLYLLTGDDGAPVGQPISTPTPTGTGTATGDPAATAAPDRDNVGMNAAMAQVDDCLINDGSLREPQMRVISCDEDPGGQVFQVLAVFNEPVDGEGEAANQQAQEICADTDGYTHHYYEVGETTSFVLCMTEYE